MNIKHCKSTFYTFLINYYHLFVLLEKVKKTTRLKKLISLNNTIKIDKKRLNN
jgi:hypothetical protein